MKKEISNYQTPEIIRMDLRLGHLCITASERSIDGTDMGIDDVTDDDFWS